MFARIKRLKFAVRLLIELYRHGGVKYSHIAFPQYGMVLAGKVILITGGSSGIGLAMARKFANCGARVIITGRHEEKLEAAVREIGDGVRYVAWDVSDISILSDKVAECKRLFAQDIDILVNNAGVAPAKFWGEVDECEWDRIYNINVKGNYFLSQYIAKDWKGSMFDGYKKIINIGSQGGYVGATYPYRMSKWDVRGLTEGLGKALIADNIIVNGIAPGVVKTQMQEFSMRQGDNLYTDQNPIHRVCLPEEIAELALFLCSDASNYIIGQTIVCDGGYTLK